MPDFLGDAVILPHRARSPFLAIERGCLCVEDHCLLVKTNSDEIEIPIARVSAILIEPGVTVTHEAIKLAAEQGTLLVWVGEAGVRVYSAGMPGGKSAARLIAQAITHSNDALRMAAAQRLYGLMFGGPMPETRSLEKMRGIEGAKVKAWYREIASRHAVEWNGRESAPQALRDALGFATSCLYGLAEVVILASGYSPAIGIIHSGDPRSLVFDLADTVKFKTVIPVAFQVFSESPSDAGNRSRRRCRDVFREQRLSDVLFDNLFQIMGNAGSSATD